MTSGYGSSHAIFGFGNEFANPRAISSRAAPWLRLSRSENIGPVTFFQPSSPRSHPRVRIGRTTQVCLRHLLGYVQRQRVDEAHVSGHHEVHRALGDVTAQRFGCDDRIDEQGAIVAVMPFGTVLKGRLFPRRNRIISGMSW